MTATKMSQGKKGGSENEQLNHEKASCLLKSCLSTRNKVIELDESSYLTRMSDETRHNYSNLAMRMVLVPHRAMLSGEKVSSRCVYRIPGLQTLGKTSYRNWNEL